EEALEKAQNAHFAADNEVRAEEAQIARANDKIEALRTRDAQATVEAREIDDQRRILVAEQDGVRETVSALEEDEARDAGEQASEEARLAELATEHAAASKCVADLRGSMGKAQSEIAGCEAKLQGFERRKTEMLARKDKLEKEREEIETGEVELVA